MKLPRAPDGPRGGAERRQLGVAAKFAGRDRAAASQVCATAFWVAAPVGWRSRAAAGAARGPLRVPDAWVKHHTRVSDLTELSRTAAETREACAETRRGTAAQRQSGSPVAARAAAGAHRLVHAGRFLQRLRRTPAGRKASRAAAQPSPRRVPKPRECRLVAGGAARAQLPSLFRGGVSEGTATRTPGACLLAAGALGPAYLLLPMRPRQ